MLLTKTVKIKWNHKMKKYYVNKGYRFTKMGDEFEVKVEDIPHGSDIVVEIQCDYCKKKINKRIKKYWSQREQIDKDSCEDCSPKKQKEISLLKYGVDHYTKAEYGKKVLENMVEKYSYRLNYEYIKECFKERGYILLTNTYLNNHQELHYLCPKHGEQKITWMHFKSGEGCKYCAFENKKGENNCRWNGGTTELNFYLRGILTEWKNESLKKYNYRCYATGIQGDLEVHHIYSFYKIMKDTFDNLKLDVRSKVNDYSKEELECIEKEFLKIHMNNLGCPLLPEIHKLYHNQYGVKDDTPKNFKEFIKRFDNHEFDEILSIKTN